VVLADVLEQHHVLTELAEGVEVRDALIEVDRAVLVVGQNDQRRFDLVGVEGGEFLIYES